MNRWLRRGAIAVAALAVLAGAALLAAERLGAQRMHRQVLLPALAPVAERSDPASIERGRYLFISRGCAHCHGDSGGGRTFVDNGRGLRLAGPNLTAGAGSATAAYQPLDWVRAIRHGVKPDGRPARVMPSEDYHRFTDEDVGALIGYLKSLPPVAGGAAVIELPLAMRVLVGVGAIRDAAAKIDHRLPPAAAVPEGVTVAHGAYVANMCVGCHGTTLAGGKVAGPPDWPPAARLTPGEGSVMPRYPDADGFVRMFKTGQRPDGSPIRVMPFDSLREMHETDVRALHLYLHSLPPAGRS